MPTRSLPQSTARVEGHPVDDTELRTDHDRPVPLHRLVYFADRDEVTIGRTDIDSYAIFPPDGAELVRRLADGATPGEAGRWYEAEYGQPADIDHVLAALDELGFIRGDGEPAPPATRIRWQRLGIALFSPAAWLVYGVVVVWALVAMSRSTDLLPTYGNLFFTPYYTLMELTLYVAAVPMILLHESFHALAGRRLGVRSRLRISNRLHLVVLETALDGLVAVPRRKRYLPILAGMLADLVTFSIFTVLADLTRQPSGALSFTGRVCLAISFAIATRLAWQFFFYLRTDLYVLITTILGCVDLHTTARRMLGNRIRRLLGQHHRLSDESDWHPVDRRAARWYSWLILVGYSVSIGFVVAVAVPIFYRMLSGAVARFFGDGATSWHELLDSAVFVGVNLAQLVALVWVLARARRERLKSQLRHVIA
jgi:hypothetical protein